MNPIIDRQDTDSITLLKHIDSLPKIKFPFLSVYYNRGFSTINLSEFKNKKLFKIPYKRNPTNVGGGGIEWDESDSTFDITDSNFIAQWNLIKKTPKFIVIEVNYGYIKLVTIDYKLNVIDAIELAAADPSSNSHFSAERQSTINEDLTILEKNIYTAYGDNNDNDVEENTENWLIDKNGFFRKHKLK